MYDVKLEMAQIVGVYPRQSRGGPSLTEQASCQDRALARCRYYGHQSTEFPGFRWRMTNKIMSKNRFHGISIGRLVVPLAAGALAVGTVQSPLAAERGAPRAVTIFSGAGTDTNF